jgi:hypothetical protein
MDSKLTNMKENLPVLTVFSLIHYFTYPEFFCVARVSDMQRLHVLGLAVDGLGKKKHWWETQEQRHLPHWVPVTSPPSFVPSAWE